VLQEDRRRVALHLRRRGGDARYHRGSGGERGGSHLRGPLAGPDQRRHGGGRVRDHLVFQEALVKQIVGYALAGGESRRMGKDKALLPGGEKALLDHTLFRLREVAARTPAILSGPEPRYADRGVPVFPD